jgi:DNA invertase Pin-like site-specific DNA recombinase
MPTAIRVALYARVSTTDQHTENQLTELRRYVAARGWAITREYVDDGISGAKERRPALDELLRDARRRRFDAIACWRLDRLGRNLKHLISLLDEFQALSVAFVSLSEGIDATTPAGKLQMHILGAIAEFERARIAERVRAGLERARRHGKRLGRPRTTPLADDAFRHLSVRQAAALWGVSKSTAARRLARGETPTMGQTPSNTPAVSPQIHEAV